MRPISANQFVLSITEQRLAFLWQAAVLLLSACVFCLCVEAATSGRCQLTVAAPFSQVDVASAVTLFGVAPTIVCVPLAKAVPDLFPATKVKSAVVIASTIIVFPAVEVHGISVVIKKYPVVPKVIVLEKPVKV